MLGHILPYYSRVHTGSRAPIRVVCTALKYSRGNTLCRAAANVQQTDAFELSDVDAVQGGVYDFSSANFVRDLVGLESGDDLDDRDPATTCATSDEEESDAGDAQGYRTADRVALLSVSLLPDSRGSMDHPTICPMADVPTAESASGTLLHSHAVSITSVAAAEDGDIISALVEPVKDGPNRLVVVKVSNYRCADTGKMDSFKFAAAQNEYNMFQRFPDAMQHKNLVQVVGMSKTPGSILLLSEFCDGGDLQQLLGSHVASAEPISLEGRSAAGAATTKQEVGQLLQGSTAPDAAAASSPAKPKCLGMSEAQVVRIASDMLQGLASMHRAGITHGDIKPANVFISLVQQQPAAVIAAITIDRDFAAPSNDSDKPPSSNIEVNAEISLKPVPGDHGCVSRLGDMVFKLGDYGTTREKGRDNLHYFVPGFGYTPEYAPPEVLLHGTSKATLAADLWSVGIIMLELLLGCTPALAKRMSEMQDPSQNSARKAWLRRKQPYERAMKELANAHVVVSAEMADVLKTCLQVLPKDRPQDAGALLSLPLFSGVAQPTQTEASSSIASELREGQHWLYLGIISYLSQWPDPAKLSADN